MARLPATLRTWRDTPHSINALLWIASAFRVSIGLVPASEADSRPPSLSSFPPSRLLLALPPGTKAANYRSSFYAKERCHY
jgi:hypothetical protein